LKVIELDNVEKHFTMLNRHEGISGAIRDLFSNDYRTLKAVDGISMAIEAGETVGFVGPNGAGKSTTIKMMTGVLEPTRGTIRVNGLTPHRDRKKHMRNIGVIFGQRTQLWWELPVVESFRLLREIYQIDREAYDRTIELFVELVRLDELFSTPVRFLSLGQRMVCDIAAAFLHCPSVIFLDEPTIGLDVSVKSKIRSLIKTLNETNATTIILTTHDVNDIETLCRRIIVIDKGRIIFDGDIQRVSKLFGAYRTLKVDLSESHAGVTEDQLRSRIQAKFACNGAVAVDRVDGGWMALTIDQDAIGLLEILSYVLAEFRVKDVKIEEIATESIIRRIYEGALR
jgi:ABC-2 type transport system ATP-binding protein